ncbi:MAG TPA: thiolase family protein [Chloroflexota bacterium]|nr:thiolase family protein [Chloroflexota bacterium]
MTDVYIAGAARTPIGKFLGGLAATPAVELGAIAIGGALDKAGLAPDSVDEVIMGNVLSAGVGQAPARQAAIKADIPVKASVMTINKVCASGLEAIHLAARSIREGEADVVVAGGMESMSGAPYLVPGARQGLRAGNQTLVDSVIQDGLWCALEQHHMGNSAEAIAEKYGLTRDDLDEYALESHRRATSAWESGAFDDEVVPVSITANRQATSVVRDEAPRADTSLESLRRLKPAFANDGLVTAGNAPGLTDGAAALVVVSDRAANQYGLHPIARVVGHAATGIEPLWLFDAPVDAARTLMERTGTDLDDYDLLEINEAFAAQIVANGRVLGWDWARVNVNGGAIALGHPLGATGARLVVTLLNAMRARGAKRGLAGLCHGGGGAVAMSFEAI